MRTLPERILLFRSGRHLDVALDALRSHAPGCEITVVATPPGMAAVEAAGIPADRRFAYSATPFFEPGAFIRSGLWWHALRLRFDRVCVLWSDPTGTGHGNVDRTALLVCPWRFSAITADGRVLEHRTAHLLRRELQRAATSVCVMAVLGTFVYLPAGALRLLGVGSARS